LEAELAEVNWRIRWDDIMFGAQEKRKLERSGSRLSLARVSLHIMLFRFINVFFSARFCFTLCVYSGGLLIHRIPKLYDPLVSHTCSSGILLAI